MHEVQKRYILAMLHLIFTRHKCGILSVLQCCQDAVLLLSCRKDNCTLCWNPQMLRIIGKICSFYLKLINIISNIIIATNNGQVGVSGLLVYIEFRATHNAYFDGTIGIHTLQSTNDFGVSRTSPNP